MKLKCSECHYEILVTRKINRCPVCNNKTLINLNESSGRLKNHWIIHNNNNRGV